MALTPQEKEDLRAMICSFNKNTPNGMSPVPVSPNILKAYAEKSDDEIRAELELFRAVRKSSLQKRKEELVKQLSAIDSVLNQ